MISLRTRWINNHFKAWVEPNPKNAELWIKISAERLSKSIPQSFIFVLKLVHAFTGNLNGGIYGPVIKFSDNLKMEKSNNGKGLHAKSFQSCPSLCDPMDSSWPGPSLRGIFQARTLEWVALPSSKGSSQPGDRTPISYVSCIVGWVLYH